jgi:hypothetical protein
MKRAFLFSEQEFTAEGAQEGGEVARHDRKAATVGIVKAPD